MPATAKKRIRQSSKALESLDQKATFDTVEEAAQAKTDHAWNTVFKHVDWEKFEELRNQK